MKRKRDGDFIQNRKPQPANAQGRLVAGPGVPDPEASDQWPPKCNPAVWSSVPSEPVVP